MEKNIKETEQRLEENILEQKEINEKMTLLPKGHINVLYRNGKGYHYLTHREGKKICNDYLGPVGKRDLSDILEKLALRERYKKELKSLKEEEKALRKAIVRKTKDAA